MRSNVIVRRTKGLSARDRREVARIKRDLAETRSQWDVKELTLTIDPRRDR